MPPTKHPRSRGLLIDPLQQPFSGIKIAGSQPSVRQAEQSIGDWLTHTDLIHRDLVGSGVASIGLSGVAEVAQDEGPQVVRPRGEARRALPGCRGVDRVEVS